MEDKEKKPDIPSNYVTLQQLKERWIKEQQRKQEQIHEQQDPEVAVVDQVEEEQQQQQKRGAGGGRNRVKHIREHRRRKHDSRVSSGGAHPEITDHGVTVAAIGGGSGSECTAAETKSAELVDKGKKKEKKKKKKKKMMTMMKKNEEKGDLGREARAPAIKSEKENVPARRFRKVREVRMEFHPKMNSTAAESDSTVEVERKTEIVEDGGDPMTGIEQKIEDLALEKTKERLVSQIEVNNRSIGANRGYNGGYKHGYNRGNQGGYGGFNHGTRRYGRYNAVNRKYKEGQGDQRVWVRKEEAADGGDDSMDQSSGGLVAGIGVIWCIEGNKKKQRERILHG